MSQIHLLKSRRFAPFFATQFLGAFNDNLYKNALIVLLTFQTASWTTLDAATLGNLAAGLFILPFFLFSATAGQLADKFDKSRLTRWIKLLEMVIIVVVGCGFWWHQLSILFLALFLLGVQSTLFGPVKYAILPQHLAEHELLGGNALIESGTFISILIGTVAGGVLAGSGINPFWIAVVSMVIAIAGFVASCWVPKAPAPSPLLRINLNPVTETWNSLQLARENRQVFTAILAISWFWFYGALLLAQFPAFARDVLGGNSMLVTILLAVFTVGIGLGSTLCDKLSGPRVELGLIPVGALGLTLFGFDFSIAYHGSGMDLPFLEFFKQPGAFRVLCDLLAIGISGGFFIVPLYVVLQSKSDVLLRARIIAANNIINALFMVVSALAAALLLQCGLSIPHVFLLAAVGNAVILLVVTIRLMGPLVRMVARVLIKLCYRVKVEGIEQIPAEGPAVLVCNHVSFVDPVLILACVRRPVRFLMTHRYYFKPVLNRLCRAIGAIPIAPAVENKVVRDAAFVLMAEALKQGDLVVIFPEGKLTRDGELNRFRYGVQRVVQETPVPVIPVVTQGLWGSFFSLRYGKIMSRPDKIRWRRSLKLKVGAPVLPADVSPEYLQRVVASLQGCEV